MDNAAKFVLPSPNFDKSRKDDTIGSKLHYLTPSGMTLLPRTKQPPPMFGPRGSTVAAKYLSPPPKFKQQTSAKLPNGPQFCEACEMELQSMDDMRRHRAQHQRCKFDGCNYRGHPSVMDKHVAALHTTGLFDKFKKLSTPEEIAAWREERRKRYPTVANVVMRQKAQEQRQKRGERLEENKSRFGKREDRIKMQRGNRAEHRKEEEEPQSQEARNRNLKNIQRNKRRRKAKNARVSQTTGKLEENGIKVKPVISATEEPQVHIGGMRMFRGTKHLKDYKHLKPKEPAKDKNALTCLLAIYGSDDDDDDEDTETDNDQAIETRDANAVHREDDEEQADNIALGRELIQRIQENLTEKPYPNEALEEVSNTSIKTLDLREKSEELIVNAEMKNTNKKEESIEKNASSDESPEEAPVAKSSQIPELQPRTEPPRKRIKTDDAPKSSRPQQRTTPQSGLDYRKARLRKQNTMLEKLLEPDIRHERNVLLQCVRFVCENNFFGVGQKVCITPEKKHD